MRILKSLCRGPLILALCMLMAVMSFAADPVITSAGSSAASTVVLTVAAASFSVTVPTSLPVNVAADGTVTVAAVNPKIVNNSAGPVQVTDVTLSGRNGWSVTDYASDLSTAAVGSKQIALAINGKKAVSERSAIISSFSAINGNDEQEFTYTANIPAQSAAITAAEVAAVTFTIGWAS